MTDSMYAPCLKSPDGVHHRTAIGYQEEWTGPKYEKRGGNLVLTESGFTRYFVVWVCQACEKTWWVEDQSHRSSIRE